MRTLLLFIFLFVNFLINKIYSQSTDRNSKFVLKGEVIGRDTGSVILWYFDKGNKGHADTVKLKKGKFHFSGTVNQVCEALLWTDTKNRNFDDPSVIRFLLETNSMYISYKVNDASNTIIKGSQSQAEKEEWDKRKSFLLSAKADVNKSIDSLAKLSKNNKNIAFENLISGKRDNINEKIKLLDLEYIRLHPNSYLSAYLLSKHTRKLSVDSIVTYYNDLTIDIKKSQVGHVVLMYVYPLTDDNEFRKSNPLVDIESYQRLSNLKSIYDLSLKDTSGNTIEMNSFKGKYLVLDFWASWCKPCIANIPALIQMNNDYKSDSIQFISISLDKSLNEWKQSIIKHNFSGIQLSDLNGFYSLAAIYGKVLWVPKYVVVDQNGRVINYDAPQPTEPELKALLDNLLKQGTQ